MAIKEFLKSKLGDAFTDAIAEEFGKELGAEFVPKNVHAEAIEKAKGLESQLAERDKQLTTLKESAKGNDALQQQIDTLKSDNEKIKADRDQELESLRFGHLLDKRLSEIGAKYPDAVGALLDRSKLKRDGDNIIGLDEQLTPMREAKPDLFNPKEGAPGAGGNPPAGGQDERKKRPEGQVIL